MKRPWWILLGTLGGLFGCEPPVAPTPDRSLPLAFQVTEADEPWIGPILARVDAVRLRLSREGAVLDTVLPARVDDGVVWTLASLAVPPGVGPTRVEARLESVGNPLFEGEGWTQGPPGSTSTVLLEPIPWRIFLQTAFLETDRLGPAHELSGEVRFATDDVWPTADIRWSSDAPSVVEVQNGNRTVARGNGHATIFARFRDIERTIGFRVRQVPAAISGVAPADTTIAAGEGFFLRAFGEDPAGYPLLTGAGVTWETEGGIVVDSVGYLTATEPGIARAHVVWNGQRWTATIDVAPTPGG